MEGPCPLRGVLGLYHKLTTYCIASQLISYILQHKKDDASVKNIQPWLYTQSLPSIVESYTCFFRDLKLKMQAVIQSQRDGFGGFAQYYWHFHSLV